MPQTASWVVLSCLVSSSEKKKGSPTLSFGRINRVKTTFFLHTVGPGSWSGGTIHSEAGLCNPEERVSGFAKTSISTLLAGNPA